MNRRAFLSAALASSASLATHLVATPVLATPALASTQTLVVYKTPSCGCCSAWIKHMQQSGFAVDARDVEQEALWELKAGTGITPELSSCHTAFVGGYFVEGHVAADDLIRLLREQPDGLGLTVPGMPIGSPGMEIGDQREAYETLLVMRDGATSRFTRHS